MASKKTILSSIHDLAAAYPQQAQHINQDFIHLWERTMADIPDEVFTQAIESHISTSKWLPAVAEIRQVARGIFKHETSYNPRPFDTSQPSDGLWEMAMGDFNDYLVGAITDMDLEASKAWGWYQRVKLPPIDNEKTRQAEEIYQQECAELSREMV